MDYITPERVLLEYDVPTNEIIMDFYDKLKSCTKGYASFDYEPIDYRRGDLVKLDIRVAGEAVDALSIIVPASKAESKGRDLVKAMKEIVPRQLFEVAIQASIGNKIIAREKRPRHGQKRDRQVLRRRHHAQAQAAREAKKKARSV